MPNNRMFSIADLFKDGGYVSLNLAPWAFLGAVPPAFWLTLISIAVTAYFRHQEIKLRREEARRRTDESARLEALERRLNPPPPAP